MGHYLVPGSVLRRLLPYSAELAVRRHVLQVRAPQCLVVDLERSLLEQVVSPFQDLLRTGSALARRTR
jgi:hypothetical protein